MASPKVATDVRDYLVSTLSISNVTVGWLADTPINQYAVFEYQGPPNIKTHGATANPGGIALDEAMIQVMHRHSSNQTAMNNIFAVVDALDGLRDQTINGTVYTYMRLWSRPRILEKQEDGSTIFIAEFHAQALR